MVLVGPGYSYLYTATCTDDIFNKLVDSVNSERLGIQSEGINVTGVQADYAGGACMVGVRDIETNEIIDVFPAGLAGNTETRPLDRPLVIKKSWTLEAFPVAVPT